MRIQRCQVRVQAAPGEVSSQNRADLADGVVEQAGIGARADRGRRVANHDAEAVGAFLDVGQQRQRDPLHPHPGSVVGQRRGDSVQQRRHLPIDHHRVQALLATEMFVDDRLGYVGALRDLFDRRPVVTAFGKQRSRDADELVTALGPRHPGARHPRRVFRRLIRPFIRSGHINKGIGLRGAGG